MQKDADNLVRIAEEEVTLLKPIQLHLLDVLVIGNASSEYQQCLASFGGKIILV